MKAETALPTSFKCELCDKPGRHTYFHPEEGRPMLMSMFDTAFYRCEDHEIKADWIG